MDERVRRRFEELKGLARLIGASMLEELNDRSTGSPLGFLLLVFDRDGTEYGRKLCCLQGMDETGFFAAASNVSKGDSVAELASIVTRMEAAGPGETSRAHAILTRNQVEALVSWGRAAAAAPGAKFSAEAAELLENAEKMLTTVWAA